MTNYALLMEEKEEEFKCAFYLQHSDIFLLSRCRVLNAVLPSIYIDFPAPYISQNGRWEERQAGSLRLFARFSWTKQVLSALKRVVLRATSCRGSVTASRQTADIRKVEGGAARDCLPLGTNPQPDEWLIDCTLAATTTFARWSPAARDDNHEVRNDE